MRVLDLADESAVFATRILGDLGADVILVEPPSGSRVRKLAPFLPGLHDDDPERSLVHQYHNANKRSVIIDIDTPAGAADLERLAATSDVIVETESPSNAARNELFAAMCGRHPHLVRASVTPFGRHGEWRDRRANDLVAGAAGGLIWVSGEASDPPVQGAANPSYTMASLAAATGVMLALAARDATPARLGSHLDISLQEATSMAVFQTANASWYEWFKFVPGRPGLSIASQCRDGGWVSFVTRPDRFTNFMAWLDEVGIDHTMTPEDWPHARIGAPLTDNPVPGKIQELTERLDREAFIEGAFKADQICLPVTDFPYMDRHEHFAANRQFFEVESKELRRRLGFVRSPVDSMAGDVEIRSAPRLGADHDAVFAEMARTKGRNRSTPEPDAPPGGDESSDPLRGLDGVRVIDFGWVLAGPLGSRILANFGAEVIRVESSTRPDAMRAQPGPDGNIGTDLGGLFNGANTGKLSVTIDLSTERGRNLVRRLIANADVVTSNFRPGALERMGLDYDSLVLVKPDIIVLSMPGTHSSGPWSPRSTLGNTVMSGSGFNTLMGFSGQRPRGMGVAYPDFTSPYLLATTVMAALRERERTGDGQKIDLSQLSGTISLLGVEWMQYRATGQQPARSANRSPNYSPHGIFPARGEDEWVAIAVEGDGQWGRLRELIGNAADPRFANHAGRKANEDALDAVVSNWTRERDRWELASRLQQRGIAAAPVENLRDTVERDPQLRHHYQRIRQPSAPDRDIPIDGEAIRFEGHPHTLVRAPMLGEHSERILREVAGLSAEEFDSFVLDGTIA